MMRRLTNGELAADLQRWIDDELDFFIGPGPAPVQPSLERACDVLCHQLALDPGADLGALPLDILRVLRNHAEAAVALMRKDPERSAIQVTERGDGERHRLGLALEALAGWRPLSSSLRH